MFVNTYRWKNQNHQNHARTYKTEKLKLNFVRFVMFATVIWSTQLAFYNIRSWNENGFWVFFFVVMDFLIAGSWCSRNTMNGSLFNGNYIIMQYNSIRRNNFMWLLAVGWYLFIDFQEIQLMANGARLWGSENEMKRRRKREEKTFYFYLFNPLHRSCSIMSKWK